LPSIKENLHLTTLSWLFSFVRYANPSQTAGGIHIRLRSRAFVFVDNNTGKRVVFVSIDGGMTGQLMKLKVVDKLQEIYSGLYTADNVCISATHTHSGKKHFLRCPRKKKLNSNTILLFFPLPLFSGPAGFLQYTLFQVTSLGYIPEAANAFVDGIVASIVKAHNNLAPGSARINLGQLAGANINRSPWSYMNNPADERARYLDVGNDTEHTMVSILPKASVFFLFASQKSQTKQNKTKKVPQPHSG
jgi:neutral ceramidase